MRIGFFTSIVPDGRPASGFEVANEAILEGLRSLGHEVVPIGVRLPRQAEDLPEGVGVLETLNLENARADATQKLRWIAQAFLTGLPMSAAKLRAVPQRRLQDLIGEVGPFDLNVINSYQMGAAFPILCRDRFVYVAHNAEHVTAAENGIQARGALERMLYRRDARLLRRIEPELCAAAGHVFVLAESDMAPLGLQPSTASVLPLVAPQAGATESQEIQYDIGMIGTWTWEANRPGLDWFLNEVVPHLPEDMTVVVAGSVPDDLKTDSRVSFAGRVESASAFLAGVRVVPLVARGGTGVQLKTIETFQAGLACVATPSSLRGVMHLPENCTEAVDAPAFAAALAETVRRHREKALPKADGAAFRGRQLDAMKVCLEGGLREAIATAAEH